MYGTSAGPEATHRARFLGCLARRAPLLVVGVVDGQVSARPVYVLGGWPSPAVAAFCSPRRLGGLVARRGGGACVSQCGRCVVGAVVVSEGGGFVFGGPETLGDVEEGRGAHVGRWLWPRHRRWYALGGVRLCLLRGRVCWRRVSLSLGVGGADVCSGELGVRGLGGRGGWVGCW